MYIFSQVGTNDLPSKPEQLYSAKTYHNTATVKMNSLIAGVARLGQEVLAVDEGGSPGPSLPRGRLGAP